MLSPSSRMLHEDMSRHVTRTKVFGGWGWFNVRQTSTVEVSWLTHDRLAKYVYEENHSSITLRKYSRSRSQESVFSLILRSRSPTSVTNSVWPTWESLQVLGKVVGPKLGLLLGIIDPTSQKVVPADAEL